MPLALSARPAPNNAKALLLSQPAPGSKRLIFSFLTAMMVVIPMTG